jgi:hypothetical protein
MHPHPHREKKQPIYIKEMAQKSKSQSVEIK